MIDKNTYLKRFYIESEQKRASVNNLIKAWYLGDSAISSKPNFIIAGDVKNLEKAIIYWLYIIDNEAEGFRSFANNKEFFKILKNVILNKDFINYFCILCPSYKKGKNAYGFAEKPGNTTYRAFNNLLRIQEVSNIIGIRSKVSVYFADIAIENAKALKASDWIELNNNINQDNDIAKKLKVPFQRLTDFSDILKNQVGVTGRVANKNLPINKKALERAMWRDRQFYPTVFGWNIEDAELRTLCHAHSYYYQGKVIRAKINNPVMIYSAYDYEKGAMYNGPDGSELPFIIYPKKDPSNPKLATLKEFKMDNYRR